MNIPNDVIPNECYACYEANDPEVEKQFGGNCFKPDDETDMAQTDEAKGHAGCWTMYGYLRNTGVKSVVRGQSTNKQDDRCEERKMTEISKNWADPTEVFVFCTKSCIGKDGCNDFDVDQKIKDLQNRHGDSSGALSVLPYCIPLLFAPLLW